LLWRLLVAPDRQGPPGTGRFHEHCRLEAEVAGWLRTAEATDTEEDKLHGRDKTGEEMPKWVADKQQRIEKIRQAKAELEAEAKAAAEAKRKEAEAAKKREATGRRKGGRPAAPPSDVPDAKAQKNFTDPESRIMKSKDGFVQAYNAQAAVDAEAQIIVAQDVTQSGVDCGQLVPLTDAIETNLGRKPSQLSADASYCSEANLAALEARNIDAYVATGRARDAGACESKKGKASAAPDATEPDAAQPAAKLSLVEAMRAKIKAGGHESPYRLRKQLPEPVFGQIKQAGGFRQFGLEPQHNSSSVASLLWEATFRSESRLRQPSRSITVRSEVQRLVSTSLDSRLPPRCRHHSRRLRE
jgi:hypothetical protein